MLTSVALLRALAASVLLSVALSGRTANAQDATAPRTLVFTGATVYPSPDEAPLPEATVVVEGERIAAVGRAEEVRVPSGATVFPCDGLVLMAGFWNGHVHFAERKWTDAATIPAEELEVQLRSMLTRWGFTSVFDTGSELRNTLALAHRVEAGEVAGPRIRTTGEILFPPGGASTPEFRQLLGFSPAPMPEVGDPEDGADAAARLLDAGADGIKVYAATWRGKIVAQKPETVAAIAEVTHAAGKLVFAHPSDGNGLRAALDGGADVLVHVAPQTGPWRPELVERMKAQHVTLIPTLKLWEWEGRHDRESQWRSFADTAVDQLRAYAAVGGTIVFGTDVGYIDDYDPSREYALMARAGMDVRAILAALTTAPARVFGAGPTSGKIAPGFDADLVVLTDDPERDVTAFARVKYAVRRGRVLFRAE